MERMTDLLHTAARMVVETRHGSPSMICRRLRQEHGVRVTFATAQHLLEQMHEVGIVGPHRGSLAREILMDVESAAQALMDRHGGDWSSWRAISAA